VHAPLADRAEQQALEAAEPARPHHEQLGFARFGDEHIGGLAFSQDRRHARSRLRDARRLEALSSPLFASFSKSLGSTEIGTQPVS
jgi:hypothetical protein